MISRVYSSDCRNGPQYHPEKEKVLQQVQVAVQALCSVASQTRWRWTCLHGLRRVWGFGRSLHVNTLHTCARSLEQSSVILCRWLFLFWETAYDLLLGLSRDSALGHEPPNEHELPIRNVVLAGPPSHKVGTQHSLTGSWMHELNEWVAQMPMAPILASLLPLS